MRLLEAEYEFERAKGLADICHIYLVMNKICSVVSVELIPKTNLRELVVTSIY